MSRAALKKELSSLPAPQLVEVILEAYDARPEIKEYFEYYLNPDVGKLTNKCMWVVERELSRSKRRHSKARVSVLNRTVRFYKSFLPGADNEVKFILAIIKQMGIAELSVDFTDTQWNLVPKLVRLALSTADEAGIIDLAVNPLAVMIDTKYGHNRAYFKRVLSDAVLEYNSEKMMLPKK